MEYIRKTTCPAFNRQVQECLCVGNVWSNTQFSNFIRPRDETECNGFTFPPGYLQDCDLKPYAGLPGTTLNTIRDMVNHNHGGVLYRLQHVAPARNGLPAHRVVHGYILTNKQHDPRLRLVMPEIGARGSKSVVSAFWDWLVAYSAAHYRVPQAA